MTSSLTPLMLHCPISLSLPMSFSLVLFRWLPLVGLAARASTVLFLLFPMIDKQKYYERYCCCWVRNQSKGNKVMVIATQVVKNVHEAMIDNVPSRDSTCK